MVLCCHSGSVTGNGRIERFWIKFGHLDHGRRSNRNSETAIELPSNAVSDQQEKA